MDKMHAAHVWMLEQVHRGLLFLARNRKARWAVEITISCAAVVLLGDALSCFIVLERASEIAAEEAFFRVLERVV